MEMVQLLEYMECPVCSMFMFSGIFQCLNGHSICENCRYLVDWCPTCKEEYLETRNLTLQRLANKLYNCCSKENYYDQKDSGDKLALNNLQCIFDTCSWKGGLKSMKKHVKGPHKNMYSQVKTDRCAVLLRNIGLNTRWEGTKMIFEELFYWKFEIRGSVVLGYVKQIGCNSSQYKYEMAIKGLIHVLHPVASVQETEDDIVASGRIFRVDLNVLQEMTIPDINGNVGVKIKINREPTSTGGKKTRKTKEPNPTRLYELEDIKCPSCKMYMISNIFECLNGHSICESCRGNVSKCGMCKVEYGMTRNFTLESLVNKLKNLTFTCTNQGCGEKMLPYDEIETHHDNCVFGKLPCPLGSCSWSGELPVLKEHLRGTHTLINKQKDDICAITLGHPVPGMTWYGTEIINKEIFSWKFQALTRALIGYVKHIGLNSSLYTYEIALNSVDNKTLVHYILPVAPVHEPDVDIMKSGQIFCVRLNILKELTSPIEDCVTIEIKINKQ